MSQKQKGEYYKRSSVESGTSVFTEIENRAEWLPKTGQKQVEQQCSKRMLASEFKVTSRGDRS